MKKYFTNGLIMAYLAAGFNPAHSFEPIFNGNPVQRVEYTSPLSLGIDHTKSSNLEVKFEENGKTSTKISKPLYKKWWVWALVGAVAGGVILASSKKSNPDSAPPPPPGSSSDSKDGGQEGGANPLGVRSMGYARSGSVASYSSPPTIYASQKAIPTSIDKRSNINYRIGFKYSWRF